MVGSFCSAQYRTQKKRSKQVPAGLPQKPSKNSAFGKLLESMLNKKKVGIVITEMELLEKTSESNMKTFQTIDDQIATILSRLFSFFNSSAEVFVIS